MKNLELELLEDLDKRVPIGLRVSVKKKHELLKCANKYGGSLTDILEVLTEDAEIKLKHDFKELLFERKKYKAKYNASIKEIERLKLLLLEKEMECVKAMQKGWQHRKELNRLKNNKD